MEAHFEAAWRACGGSGVCQTCRGMRSAEIDRLYGDDGCPDCEGAEECHECDGEGGGW